MSARISRRFLSLSSLRAASASSRSNVAAATGRALARRGMASEAHGAHKSGGSDLTWMVGSAVVFLPLCGYLLSPAARSKGHHVNEKIGQTDEAHKSEPEPVLTDDEGTKKSASEVKDSLTRSEETDAPKEAHDAEVREAKGEPKTSAESTEAPADKEEKSDSSDKTDDTFSSGSPAQSSGSPSESSPVEQKSPPTDRSAHKGTVQSEGDDVPKPTEMGEARKESKQGKAPKEAEKDE
ncbi:uncharacterized protein STEHIDRAFT_131682 [Stereum hirsutum FP-91666 SS1]|uniref:uncharacterized protein n=1 Tax=Stereum hirsutum (strain FP-91666) TaxID=721885 RepID=UPI000444A026|nr:uncharacterized protein STEHIDRAFT_131682 [Stereum hirsutum FP-91666 SS1]EIM86011.1 hypothetical protein STEHIDRAFT_131682 [Stereum hirsutum FP-91666 SS1]